MISFDSENAMELAIFTYISEMGATPWGTTQNVQNAERQVDLGGYGIADIIISYLDLDDDDNEVVKIEIIELKNTKLKAEHVSQLARYRAYFELAGVEHISCTLIGLSTLPDGSDLCYLLQGSEWMSAYEVVIDLSDGVTFSEISGWKPTRAAEGQAALIERFSPLMKKKPESKGFHFKRDAKNDEF